MTLRHRLAKQLACDASAVGSWALLECVSPMKRPLYRLARWINRDSETIPRSTLEKAPSAELKPDQKDQDTLPPYEILDPILECFVEEQLSAEEIIARGFDPQTVYWVIQRVIRNEYKRAQAAPGLKVTSRAFGVGRKMPVAHRYSGLHA